MKYDPNLVVPPEVVQAVQTIREFAAKHDSTDNWQIGGLTPVQKIQPYPLRQVRELQRKLAAEQAKHDETLDMGEKLLAATNKLQCQLAEANEDKATLHVSLREAYTQLAEVTRERDALRAMLVVADARINRLVGGKS